MDLEEIIMLWQEEQARLANHENSLYKQQVAETLKYLHELEVYRLAEKMQEKQRARDLAALKSL